MEYRHASGTSCARCALIKPTEDFEISADGPICRACVARQATAHLDQLRTLDQKRARGPAAHVFVLVLLPYLAWGTCATRAVDESVGVAVWGIACCAALVGVALALQRRDWWAVALGLTSPFVSFILAMLVPGFHYSRGRALRRSGVARMPNERPTSSWLTTVGFLSHAPPAVAAGWRINAATETASVAAFSHLATELLALGAPADLVAKAHEDALDEIRHARMCYALAESADGRAIGPDAFPYARRASDTLSFASLAADCIVESCLFESASARVAAAMLSREDLEPAVRTVLEAIAVDEARHAEHGREIVSWCIEAAGADAFERSRRALANVDAGKATTPFAGDSLERFGLAGTDLWRAMVTDALADARGFLEGIEQHAFLDSRGANRETRG